MPPKDYDLLNRVYGSSVYRPISNGQPEYRYDPVHSLIVSLNMVIGNLDQYSEDEILETLPKIERYINDLPLTDSIKQILCDTLWNPRNTVQRSLELIVTSLKT